MALANDAPGAEVIRRCELPAQALLHRYSGGGGHADCYCTQVPGEIAHAAFVAAFYTTWLFRVERVILATLARRPSSDDDVRRLAVGDSDGFAAWKVEARAPDQLLLADVIGNTRSWLMVVPGVGVTTLYFGSAVLPKRPRVAGAAPRMGMLFRALLGFHALYSRTLLATAAHRLARLR
jgi:hypothetical protein